jgi:hypothetical protein
MKILLKILISLTLISASLILIWFIKSMQPSLFPTTYLILIAGSSVNLIAGIGLLLIAIQLAKKTELIRRKTEQFTAEKVQEVLEKKLYNVDEGYMEGRLLFEAGALAAYLKRRGEAMGKLTKTGEYLSYENFMEGFKWVIKYVMEKIPGLKDKSYTLPLLLQIEDPYVGKVLEKLAEIYETCKIIGMNYIPAKVLKSFASILKKYIKE